MIYGHKSFWPTLEVSNIMIKKGLTKNRITSIFWLTIKHNAGLETVDTVTGAETSLNFFNDFEIDRNKGSKRGMPRSF